MEENDEEDAIPVLRLCTWSLPLQGITDAALSPSLTRLLLFQSSSGTAQILNLRSPLSPPVSPAGPVESFAWASSQDCYTGGRSDQELLITCGSRGLVTYGFTGSESTDHIVDINPDFSHDDAGGPTLAFGGSTETWPPVVSFTVPYDSPSFSTLLANGTESLSITRLISSATSWLAMLLSRHDMILVSRVHESGIQWTSRIVPPAGNQWVDFCFVLDKLLGLTRDGKLFMWDAATGEQLSVTSVLPDGSSYLRLVPAQSRRLVGVVDALGQIFLVSLQDQFSQLASVSSWELADSDISLSDHTMPVSVEGPSGFMPRRLLAGRHAESAAAAWNERKSGAKLRQVVLPLHRSSAAPGAIAISSCVINRLVTVHGRTTVVQHQLYAGSHTAKDVSRTYAGEAVAFASQGSLYLVSPESLAVVLPPLLAAAHPSQQAQWWSTGSPALAPLPFHTSEPCLRQWQLALLDRSLLHDGLREAEYLFTRNGWALRLVRLRMLELALCYQRVDEVGSLLSELVHAGAAEAGLIRVIFTVVKLILNPYGTDNELGLASRLLALTARFTRDLLKSYGSRTTIKAHLPGLAHLLETIRHLQEKLHLRRKGPKTEKGTDLVTEVGENVESTSQPLTISVAADESTSSFSTGLVPSDDEGSSRKHPSQESPKEMIARWEKERVDVQGIVKDALRAGRLPLAVVRLHHRKRENSGDDLGGTNLEADVFKEVQDAGRSIVYEQLCKGKMPLALAALRRLGEDIRTALHDLAFGTVRRSLRSLTIRELRRHGNLDARDYQLISTVSRIESAYPSCNFGSSYTVRKPTPDDAGDQALQIQTPAGDIAVRCGEIDGVVFGSWSNVSGDNVEDEALRDQNSGAYWAGALVWLQDLDYQTIDRLLLEQSQDSETSWESKLKFAVVHHQWAAVSSLMSDVRSLEVQELELSITTGNGADSEIRLGAKRLVLDLDACTGWLWNMIERELVRSSVFLRRFWHDPIDLLSLLSHVGLLSQFSVDKPEMLLLVARHCVKHSLPWLLELHLEKNSWRAAAATLNSVDDIHWLQWLLLSRQPGSEYHAAFANASTVLATTVSTLNELTRFGSDLMALATLLHAPALPQKCLYTGSKKPHGGKSWHCLLLHLLTLLKDYPTLWNVLRSRCTGADSTRSSDYLEWRKCLFRSSSGDISLALMLPRSMPRVLRRVIHLAMQGFNDHSFMNPVSWEESIRKSVESELCRRFIQISSSKIEQFLLRGCPLAAYHYFVKLRAQAGKAEDFSALEKHEEELLGSVLPLAIRNFRDTAVTAACALLSELCGVSATVLRCNISTLERISQHADEEGSARTLAELLSDEYSSKGVAGRVEEQTAAILLQHLERATMAMNTVNGCGVWLKNGEADGQSFRTAQMCMSANWSLVTTFCKLHYLPPSTVYLSYLARDNDWVGFLAEAQAEGCPLDLLLSVASENFTDDRLRSHIISVLQSSSRSEKMNSDEVFQKKDLFTFLADAERLKASGAELLAKAKNLSWPLLTVVASCFSDVTPHACLAAWLEVTAARETSRLRISDDLGSCVGTAVDATNATVHMKSRLPVYVHSSNSKRRRLVSPEMEEEFSGSSTCSGDASHPRQNGGAPQGMDGIHEFLTKMVVILCEKQQFIPLLRAFELFLPALPLLHFIRFLRAFSQMRLSEASAHLADFSTLLKDEVQSKGARSNVMWISRAAVAGANAVLAACPSVYEKRCMLQLLAAADFGDGGAAAMGYRKHYWKIQLAEPSLREGRRSMLQTSGLDDEDLLSELEKSGEWEEARSWARQLDLGQQESSHVHHVTEMQAEAMVTEWKELLWDVPEQRAALWRHCQALFTKHLYPPLKAGMFFLKHAEDVEHHGLAAELHAVLLLALQWLSGSITGSAPVYPVHLLRELETRVWLLAVESEVLLKTSTSANITTLRLGALNLEPSFAMPSASPVDRTATKIAAVDGHLRVYQSTHMDFADEVAAIRQAKPLHSPGAKDNGAKPKRRLVRRVYNSGMEQNSSDTGERKTAEESVPGWEEKVGEGEVERAILALVEVGQVSAARQLQLKLLPSRVPAELAFAETALSIAKLSSLTVKGSIRGSVLGASVMKTLNSLTTLKDVSSASPLQVMEALTAACREGCGRGHCRRVSAVAQIANFLDLSFFEAFQKQPTELLQLLSLKGQDALPEAKLLVATHSINPASIARILAESFLKGLLAAHRGGYMDSWSTREEGPAPLLWRSSDFVLWAQLCPSEPELGHALMRLVISGHDMPHGCEVELLILAHQFYESSACLDGMDVLVALAATRVESYVAEGDFAALARLVTGVSNFQALRFVLDLLIENGQLELLLKRRASTVEASKESLASVRGFRMAVLSALRHFNAHDLDAFGMVYTHFSMAHEMANLLESRGRKGLNHRFIWNDPDQNEELLEVMKFFVDASEVYAGIDCGNRTRWCCAQASLLSLQLRMPELLWLNLTETNARRLLVEQRRFQEALIVAEAYNLNQPAEWVPVLWNQVLSPGWIEHFLSEFVASLPLRPSMLMELARIYRSEVSARGDHLDFSKWLTSGMPPEITKSFRCILRHVGDFRLRTQLTTLASGFPDVLDVCARILDKVPDTAGPLVLKRGHGQTYVPLM